MTTLFIVIGIIVAIALVVRYAVNACVNDIIVKGAKHVMNPKNYHVEIVPKNN